MADDHSKSTIRSSRHRSTFDTAKINRAIERVARGDDRFIDNAISQLEGLQFPAFKHKILEYVRNKTTEPDIIGLFESLDGYIAFRDTYHLRKAIEVNGVKYKMQNQITDETRVNPNFKTRQDTGGTSTKEKEAVNRSEERKDYPEVTPTAMSDFVCKRCGKAFQNQNDLVQHRRFENGVAP